MILINSNATIAYGRVQYVKPGSGNAKDRLAIVKIRGINQNGRDTDEQIKLLFWNNRFSKDLAVRASRLQPGDIISAKIQIDEGDPHKAVGFEFKKSGVYTLRNDEKETSCVIHGKINGYVYKPGFLCVSVPVRKKVINMWQDITYFVKICGTYADTTANRLRSGDTILARGPQFIKKKSEKNQCFELCATRAQFIHDTIPI